MKLISLAIVFFSTVLSNCREEVQSSAITKIEFGTSFGMCSGYCTQVVTLSDGLVEKTVTPRLNQDLEEKSCSASFKEFNTLTSQVDAAAFMSLDEVIGCPDCADGGAEWIEITTPEGSKKVTYEFRKAPKQVAKIIDQLRAQYDKLGECE